MVTGHHIGCRTRCSVKTITPFHIDRLSLKVAISHQFRVIGLRRNHSFIDGVIVRRLSCSILYNCWMFHLSRFMVDVLSATIFACGEDIPLPLLQVNGLCWETIQAIQIHAVLLEILYRTKILQKFTQTCEFDLNVSCFLLFAWLIRSIECINLCTAFAE